ncbi:MAG: oxidoreductase [Anaerolineaceae bacterium]|nr:oxidoreductase [Anaerolineaceae bacterium]
MTEKTPTLDTASESKYRIIGKRVDRYDAADKVTGQAVYGADVHPSNLLYGKVLRSPHAHARILSIDTSAAEALEGVHAVITGADLPSVSDRIVDLGETATSLRYQSDNILAKDKALYFGHAIAAVSATQPYIAEEAVSLIKVEYEILPPVLDVRKAMRPDSTLLHDDIFTDELGQKSTQASNVASHIRHAQGDVEAGFRQADVIIEHEFETTMVHQGYIEPHNATAIYNPSGQITIWCSTQGSFGVRSQTSDVLDVPISSVHVIPTEIGGGFGGKNSIYLEPLAVLLSKKSNNRPVKLTMTRAESLAATGPTSGSYIRVKLGADANGHLTAAKLYLAYEAGAFPGSPVGSAAGSMISEYRISNVLIDGYDVVVNKPRTEAYRAPGTSNAVFAVETVVDELCEKLGMDPIAFRLLNAAKEGDRRPDGPTHPRIGFIETLQAAQSHDHYQTPLDGKYRGRGVACGYWGNWGGRSSVSASMNADGTISLITGSIDLSGTRTTTAMQLAETLGIDLEDIVPQVADTNSVSNTEGTYGSRTTFATGWAAHKLGCKLIDAVKERAALLWDIPVDTVDYEDGCIFSKANRLTFKDISKYLDETGGPLMVSATSFEGGHGPSATTHIVDVEVDPDTGKVDILRYTAIQDVGKAIHPDFVEGQIQGGVVQGIGWALNEGYFYNDEGQLLNANFLDYRMPTFLDVPMIEAVLVEVSNPRHPYGVRGVGEVPIVPPPAAVANAIHDAIGVRLTALPMSPARVLEAVWEQTPSAYLG